MQREDAILERANRVLEAHREDDGGLIGILEQIQEACGYLPERALRAVARKMGASVVDVYGVATFYRLFSLKPLGKHIISVCLGTACHVNGGPMIIEEFERELGIKTGETTPDGEFSLTRVNCLGACALGPMVVVDGHYFSNVDTVKVKRIVGMARDGLSREVVVVP